MAKTAAKKNAKATRKSAKIPGGKPLKITPAIRRQVLASVTKREFCELSGRQVKTLNEQADRYGLPLRGKTVDLFAAIKSYHDLIATNSHRLKGADEQDPMLAEGDSPALERYRNAKADLAELEREERVRNLLPRQLVHSTLGELAELLRSTGDVLRKQFGKEAYSLLERMYDVFERRAGEFAGDGEK
jgi:hypothetical protein